MLSLPINKHGNPASVIGLRLEEPLIECPFKETFHFCLLKEHFQMKMVTFVIFKYSLFENSFSGVENIFHWSLVTNFIIA